METKDNTVVSIGQPVGGHKAPSQRKLIANRKNALLSTGPKTQRGKSYSRCNALKHGLFLQHLEELHIRDEDPASFSRLHCHFLNELQPVGALEEIEVERIAICQWRLMRAWRYENAEIRLGQERIKKLRGWRFLRDPRADWSPIKQAISDLEAEEQKIESSGEAPDKVLEGVRRDWGPFYEEAEERARAEAPEIAQRIAKGRAISVEEAERLLKEDPHAQPEYARFIVLTTRCIAAESFSALKMPGTEEIRSAEIAQQSIPHRDSLDRIMRYEASIERSLNRAYDRLERLQRRRLGEPLPPSVSLRLTQ